MLWCKMVKQLIIEGGTDPDLHGPPSWGETARREHTTGGTTLAAGRENDERVNRESEDPDGANDGA